MEESTPEDIAAFNSAVQAHIDARAAEGVTLSWADAVKQVGNLLSNIADDHDAVAKQFSRDQRLNDLEARVAHLEEIGGGVVVGPDGP